MNKQIMKLDFDVNSFNQNSKDLFTKVFTLVNLQPTELAYKVDFKIEKDLNENQTRFLYPVYFQKSLHTTDNLKLNDQVFALKSLLITNIINDAISAIINIVTDKSLIVDSVVKIASYKEHIDEEKVENDYIDYIVYKLIKDSGISDNPRITNIKPVFITDSYSFYKLNANNKITQLNRDSVVITPHASVQDKLIIVLNYDYEKDDSSIAKITFGTIPYYDFVIQNNTIIPRYRILINTPVVGEIDFKDKIIVN